MIYLLPALQQGNFLHTEKKQKTHKVAIQWKSSLIHKQFVLPATRAEIDSSLFYKTLSVEIELPAAANISISGSLIGQFLAVVENDVELLVFASDSEALFYARARNDGLLTLIYDVCSSSTMAFTGEMSSHSPSLLHLCIHFYFTPQIFSKPSPVTKELVYFTEEFKTSTEDFDISLLLPSEYPLGFDSPIIQSKKLKCTLLPYQKRAIAWMLRREGFVIKNEALESVPLSPILHRQIQMTDSSVFINPISNQFYENNPETPIRGSILADEMGMGKTVMVIALILLNSPSNSPDFVTIEQSLDANETKLIRSTLIITPTSILRQWVSEIKRHAPRLKYYIFKGGEVSVDFSEYDIVFTSYKDLRQEYYAALPESGRKLRYEKKYKKRFSPLVHRTWWRVVVDEAQMVEQSSSLATQVARLLPRVFSLAVTGTPITRHGLDDIFGLILFLKGDQFEKYWKSLRKSEHELFRVLPQIMHRNTKKNVENELQLPAQNETIIKLNFHPIEQHYYEFLDQECRDALLASDYLEISTMKSWLIQLRQTCCHPQVGQRNRTVLGAELHSMIHVLKLLLRGSVTKIYHLDRELHLNQIKKAHGYEFKKEFLKAIELYSSILRKVEKSLKEIEIDIQDHEEMKSKNAAVEDTDNSAQEELDSDDDLEYVSQLKIRRTTWKELKHRLVFFIACCYHSLTKIENISGEDRQIFSEQENKFYDDAAHIRKSILTDDELSVEKIKEKLIAFRVKSGIDPDSEDLLELIISAEDYHGGIRTNIPFENLRVVTDLLNVQLEVLLKWRSTIFDCVTKALEESEAAGDAPDGEEFESGRQNQETAFMYLKEYDRLLSDRKFLLTGENFATQLAADPAESDLEKDLKRQREELLLQEEESCMRVILNDLREIKKTRVPAQEVAMIDIALKYFNSKISENLKYLQKLTAEQTHFYDLYNSRVIYYGQLQKISDGVIDVEPPKDLQKYFDDIDAAENALNTQILPEIGKRRYMKNLLAEELQKTHDISQLEEECGICRNTITLGQITGCGHIYCQACLESWMQRNNTHCPLCKQRIGEEVFLFTRKKKEEEKIEIQKLGFHESKNALNSNEMQKILSRKIEGSFGTKIDAIVKHILHLKSIDPHVKVLIFSQWEQVLEYLTIGLHRNDIRTIKIEGKKGEDAPVVFREDPLLTVFLLNAKSQSSGLTLTVATHVFIVEPVMSGLDKQAINRVNRIGQTKETFVWRYIIKNTVEERVMELLSRDDEAKGLVNLEWAKSEDGSHASLEYLLGLFKQ